MENGVSDAPFKAKNVFGWRRFTNRHYQLSTNSARQTLANFSISDGSLNRHGDGVNRRYRLPEKFFGAIEEAFTHRRVFLAAEVGEFLELPALLRVQFRGHFYQDSNQQI